MSNSPSSDVIYYNVIINNTTTNPIPANYSEQRTIPLLKNPSEYYISIIRFSVPGFSIPILVCPVTNNTIPLTTPYKIKMTYGLLTSERSVIFYPRINPSSNPPVNPQDPYYFIYEYQQFIDMVNITLQTTVNDLIALGAPPGLLAPYFIFNENTQLISLIVPTNPDYYSLSSSDVNTYTPTLPAGKVGIYLNNDLFSYFQGIETISLDPDYYWVIVKNNENNYYQDPAAAPVYPPEYLEMKQQFNAINNWNSFSSLAFLSNSLPTLKEFTPGTNLTYNGNTQSGANTVPILTDFVPLLQNAGDQRSDFVYNPTGPYRLVNLLTNDPIYAVDIAVVWYDQYNRQYPIYLEPGQSISIKIMFVKKSAYKYPYN